MSSWRLVFSGGESAIAEPASARAWRRLLAALCIAAWFALAFGLLELGAQFTHKLALGGILRVSRQIVWMAPAGLFLLIAGPSLLLWLLSLRSRRAASLRVWVLVPAFLSMLGLLLLPKVIGFGPAALLAAGLSWHAAAVAERYRHGFARLVRRSLPVMAATILVLALAANAGLLIAERQALARLPAAQDGAPNILLIIWDTVRAASLGLHGYDKPTTPNLEQLATRGVVFDRALTTAPWTLPAHVSLFTGLLPFQTNAGWVYPLNDDHPTLAERLAGAGYATGGFSANFFYVEWEYGLARGFSRFDDYRITPGQILLSTALGDWMLRGKHQWLVGLPLRLAGYEEFIGRKPAPIVTKQALAWIDKLAADRPFFAFLNYFDAHRPYLPPDTLALQFGPARSRVSLAERVRREVNRRGPWDDADEAFIAAEQAAYDGAIRYLDEELGYLLRELEARGLLENTVVVVASDHGEGFGEREGIFDHATDLDMWQLHVPLVIVQPSRIPAGVRVSEGVSIRDIPATLLSLAGAEPLAGVPLTRFWTRADPAQYETELVYAELTPSLDPTEAHRSLLADSFLFIRRVDGARELYNVNTDPLHYTNFAQMTHWEPIAQRFETSLSEILRCEGECDLISGFQLDAPSARSDRQ